MPDNKSNASNQAPDLAHWKPGSQAELAKDVAAKGDFGVPETGRSDADRDYVSRNTKLSDPDAARPRAGESEGIRVTGVGTYRKSDGSGSAGDIDTDIIGVGTGGSGISASGPDDDQDAAEVQPQTPKASHTTKLRPVAPGEVAMAQGSSDRENETGADNATSPERGDDAFAGEISSDEASGMNDHR